MNNLFLFVISAIGVVSSATAVYYINVLKNSFKGLRRLEKPWLLLEFGVASLFVAALSISCSGISSYGGTVHLVQIAAVVVSAFFILTAMVTMKQAWTITESD